MITREDFIQSIAHEVAVLKHLFGKLPEGALDFRPTPGQRSMRELLLYIPSMLAISAQFLITGDRQAFLQQREAHMARNAEDFPRLLDEAFATFKGQIEAIADDAFQSREVTLPTGQVLKLGPALLNFTGKFVPAYKLQFFLYLKQAGRSELTTANAWAGRDMPMPAASPPSAAQKA
jgi:hypothetical protein